MCQNECPTNIYMLNGSINQCNSSCALPFGIQTTSLVSPAAFICSACVSPNFIQRSNSSCVTSCDYVNATSVNSTSVTICETPGDATFCHFLKFAQVSDTFLTCVSACLATELVYTNSTFSQCVTSCPADAKYIQVDQTSCGTTCSTGFFSYNTSRSNP